MNGELAKALVAAQMEMKNPAFDSKNPHFNNRFASLAAVREAVMPVLNKHGLALIQFPKSAPGFAGCCNVLIHTSGESVQEDCLLPLDKNNAQGAGSAITYSRRYSLQAIAGVVAEEDDDANAASKPAKLESAKSVAQAAWDALDAEEQKFLQGIADETKTVYAKDGPEAAWKFIVSKKIDNEEIIALWSRFASAERTAMKTYSKKAA